MERHCYRAYGLTLRSELPLPELRPATPGDPVDVEILRRPIARRQAVPTDELFLELDGEDSYFEFSFVGRILLRGCSRIDVDPNPGVAPGVENLALLGAVMAVLLQNRGLLTLHGGAVQTPAGACVFLGDKGAGKSTLVSALTVAGHRLLADDIAAIRFENGAPSEVVPGYPQVKISPTAAALLNIENAVENPMVIPDFSKLRLQLPDFCAAPLPVAGVYILSRGDSVELSRMTPSDAFAAIVRYSHGVRFGGKFLHGKTAARHMEHCAALAGTVPVFSLQTPASIEHLPEISRLLPR